jgi:hypothetical protein
MLSLRQVQRRHGRRPAAPALAPPAALTLRVAAADDSGRVAELAQLDSSAPLELPALTAELDGELCVAVSLIDLRAVADPFRLTAPVRAIAVARAQQLRGASAPKRRVLSRVRSRHGTADAAPRAQRAT